MILGVGVDLVDPQRIARALAAHGGAFEARVFTAAERADCADRHDRHQALAARFAAKEACLKALGTGWRDGLAFRQVEVVRGDAGQPLLRLSGAAAELAGARGVRRLHLSLSHEQELAVALVVLEG